MAFILVLAGCATSGSKLKIDDSALNEYQQRVDALTKENSGLSGPTAAQRKGLEAWKELISDLSVEHLEGRVSQVYAEDTFLNDTLITKRTAADVEDYLLETARMLDSGTVEFKDTVWSPDGGAYVRWEMVYEGKKLAGGQPIRTIGMSHLYIDQDSRVVLQQDFWDSTRGLFEQVPVVGPQIHYIKGQLQ